MTAPVNNQYIALLAMQGILSPGEMLRTKFDYDEDGNLIYVGVSNKVDADEALADWYILNFDYVTISEKFYTSNMYLPDGGVKMSYVWDDRATYF